MIFWEDNIRYYMGKASPVGDLIFLKATPGLVYQRRLTGEGTILSDWCRDRTCNNIIPWEQSGWKLEEISVEYAELLFAMLG